MAYPWNLRAKEWANVLCSEVTLEDAAAHLRAGKVLPWSLTLLRYTEDSNRVLDLGSGRGEHSAWLALKGKEVTLLDFSRDNIEFSRRLFQKLNLVGKFAQADMTKSLPFDSGSFDTVFSCGVFEYFSDDEIRRILEEAFRITKRRVIIVAPNALSVAYRLGKWYMERSNQWRWGGERPLRTLKLHFRGTTRGKVVEFTLGTRHALNFLTMPGGKYLRSLLLRALRGKCHSEPSFLRQGYLLVTIGEKA